MSIPVHADEVSLLRLPTNDISTGTLWYEALSTYFPHFLKRICAQTLHKWPAEYVPVVLSEIRDFVSEGLRLSDIERGLQEMR